MTDNVLVPVNTIITVPVKCVQAKRLVIGPSEHVPIEPKTTGKHLLVPRVLIQNSGADGPYRALFCVEGVAKCACYD